MASINHYEIFPVQFVNESEDLTLAKAKNLIGKKVMWTYSGYSANSMTVYETLFGEIISEFEYATRIPHEGYSSRADYWEKELPRQAAEAKKTLVIIDADGECTYIRCYTEDRFFDEPTFVCSDADRVVYFKEVVE